MTPQENPPPPLRARCRFQCLVGQVVGEDIFVSLVESSGVVHGLSLRPQKSAGRYPNLKTGHRFHKGSRWRRMERPMTWFWADPGGRDNFGNSSASSRWQLRYVLSVFR